ncbi:Molybdopterin synthase sulfur carrier subunit [Strongyloides ratti]|uniref:Molybdopterin synthase sulfur carrier subunit n=1 Tax=Strongyloides ratti TaxID=34506 RepID=A0A090L6Q0_STRRB|nr:Molybdopterin synthase sulfur carrier subunit [Strongyloides ratti]CEF65422.1 Molybdopterin synthase sulfur carrier subunit [Strongyloides ratti]
MVFILCISGCTCSGKTTLSNALFKKGIKKKINVEKISQDDFYVDKEKVKQIRNNENSDIIFYDYDSISALDKEKIINVIEMKKNNCDLLIVEGTMLLEINEIVTNYCDKIIYVTLEKNICNKRRKNRNDYDPPDNEGYFDQVVWPSYQNNLDIAKKLSHMYDKNFFTFVDGESIKLEDIDNFCNFIWRDIKLNVVRIVDDTKIDINVVNEIVTTPSSGATSIFVGTTRDNFNNKKVIRLEYECYKEMALKEMKKLCLKGREKFKTIHNIAIFHRINHVPVTEASVVIAVSSPHRHECQEASNFLIDELKVSVPIWKKEIYSDNSGQWKENCCKK